MLAAPLLLTAQEAEPDAAIDSGGVASSAAAAIPRPTMGWVLKSNGAEIPAEFGGEPLRNAESGVKPAIAADGAGNIDGAALVGGVPSGAVVTRFALASPTDAVLESGTTVILLCGRANYWLRSENGTPLPVAVTGASWSVTKPNEWGVNLDSSVSPFAVALANKWVYASAPPPPTEFVPFFGSSRFPDSTANAQVCVWAMYDASLHGSADRPEISAAYDDGAAGAPVRLAGAVGNGGNPLEVLLGKVGADLGTLFVWQGATAERMLQQSARAAYWNGGLRQLAASGFQTEPWNGLDVTHLNPLPIAEGGDAEDNTRADSYASFVRTSPFAHYSVTTAAGTPFLAVRYQLGNYLFMGREFSVSFAVDGVYLGYDQPWRYGTNLRSIPLPQDGRSHTVELINGFTRNNGNYSAPTVGTFGGGGFIDAVAAPKGYVVKVNHPAPASVALVLSHSVAVGEDATATPYEDEGAKSSVAWPVLARAVKAFGTASVTDESYGGELLANNCWTLNDCTSYLAAIKKAQPRVKVGFVARMLNDFYHGRGAYNECLSEYQRSLGYLISAWEQEFPGVPLYVGSDIRESAHFEAVTDGCADAKKLADWREGIREAVESYITAHHAEWLHFVDMTEWVPQNEIGPSGIHPTTQGQVALCQAVAEYFHQQVPCAVPH